MQHCCMGAEEAPNLSFGFLCQPAGAGERLGRGWRCPCEGLIPALLCSELPRQGGNSPSLIAASLYKPMQANPVNLISVWHISWNTEQKIDCNGKKKEKKKEIKKIKKSDPSPITECNYQVLSTMRAMRT